MSGFEDDEVDEELLNLFRNSLGSEAFEQRAQSPDTGVLRDARKIYEDAVDVAIDYAGTKAAAKSILEQMKVKAYSAKTWSSHDLHPKEKTEATVRFIFTLDLLNFCFWPEGDDETFAIEYQGKTYTRYWSLVAVLQRALAEGISITTPCYWQDEDAFTFDVFEHVFRSSNGTTLSMLDKRFNMLRHAGQILYEYFHCSVMELIKEADRSAVGLVNLLVDYFPQFRDEVQFQRRTLHFYKRAQIFVADLWACFEGESYGAFNDVHKITMFADYRIPQMLYTLGCLQYSPALEYCIRSKKEIPAESDWEIELRGCSIWCVELIRQNILQIDPKSNVNAILIDFFLYDMAKDKETEGIEVIPHHRTKSIWY